MDLRALRKRAGLKITDVAHILECAESSIRNWEKGRTMPKLEIWQVFRIRDLYRCTESELVIAARKSMQAENKEPTQQGE
jgi:putative transcriptional regulator